MRPRALTMTAFGPYAAEQTLDFDVLPAGTLFLVHGPTGSGKTSVLDAICFALYGESSGTERDGFDLRSHHALPTVETRVSFDFSLGADHYRVVRAPRQTRAKLRGEGITTIQPKAELFRLDSESTQTETDLLESGDSKVTAIVEDLLQLDSAQFRQVVLLPQGRFRRLLTASSKEREDILERLFQTRRYRAIEDALKVRKVALEETVKARLQRHEALADRLATRVELPADTPRTHVALQTAWTALDERLTTARAEADTARTQAEAAGVALKTAEAHATLFAEQANAGAAHARVEAAAEAIARQRTELASARQAAPLEARLDATEAGLTAATAAAAQVVERTAELDGAKAAATAAATVFAASQDPEAKQALHAARAEVTTLEDHAPKVASLASAVERAVEATGALTTATGLRDEAAAALPRCEAALEQADATQKAATLQAAGVDGARAEVTGLEQLRDQRAAATAARVARDDARQAKQHQATLLSDAVNAEAAATQALETARRAREQGSAVVLARSLTDGAPCPVCGATDHPRPALDAGALPDEAALDTLEAEATQATARVTRARTAAEKSGAVFAAKAAILQTASEALSETDDDALTPALLQERLAEAGTRLTAATQAMAQQAGLDTARERAKTALAQAREAQRAAGTAYTTSATDEARASTAVATLEATVPEAVRTAAALAHARTEAATRVASLEQRETAARAARERTREALTSVTSTHAAEIEQAKILAASAEAATQALDAALRESEFHDVLAARTALRTATEVTALAKAVTDHDKASQSAADWLKRARAAVCDLPMPDVEGARTHHETFAKQAATAAGARDVLDARVRESAADLTSLAKDAEDRAKDEEALRVVGGLADVATGANDVRLSFHRFVLAALLDEVLEVASNRLLVMSQGRYQLQRRTGAVDRRKGSGLDLEIHDAWTGEPRPATTLSGGEGFLAALALALATAEVVQRHAGGIHLDAIFIDEGFGSLDEASLDMAVDTLVELGEGGRLVGVISHVAELRERIHCRLAVTGGPSGSTVRFVIP